MEGKMWPKKQYRVVWKRFEQRRKTKNFAKRARAEWYSRLLASKEPWAMLGDPDKYVCCSGYQCGCSGITLKEELQQKYADVPPLEVMPFIEEREVGQWEKVTLENNSGHSPAVSVE